MKTTTRLTPQRRAERQTLKSALQRLTMTLILVMLTTMTAWAQDTALTPFLDSSSSNPYYYLTYSNHFLRVSWSEVNRSETTSVQLFILNNTTELYAYRNGNTQSYTTLYNGNSSTHWQITDLTSLTPGQESFGYTSNYKLATGASTSNMKKVCTVTCISAYPPTWNWSADYSTCTVTFTCRNKQDLTTTLDATVTPSDDSATASVTFNGINYTDTKYFNSVDYIDENGTLQTKLKDEYTVLSGGGETKLTEGWYVVKNTNADGIDAVYTNRINLGGDVHLILCDGAEMSVNVNDEYGITGGHDLTIYSQSFGSNMGKLTVSSFNYDAIHANNFTVNGAHISASAEGEYSDGAIDADNITINRGIVSANAQGGEFSTGLSVNQAIIINGGNVTASGTICGISTIRGDITLGWSNATDCITANSFYTYKGSVKIATGKSLSDGTNTYDENTSSATLAALTNVTLTPPTYGVTANRATTEDTEYWSTFYHPAAGYTADENTTVYQAAVNTSTNMVELTAVPGKEIPADKAVVLKSTQSAITLSRATTTQTLEGNELKGGATVADGMVPYTLAAKSGTVGFYKYVGAALNPNKAHLEIAPTLAPAYFGFDENTTAINEHESHESHELSGEWYSLDGRKLSGEPSAKGIYVRNGRKFIIK